MNSQNSRRLNEVYSIYDKALLGKGSTGNVYLGCANNNPNQKVAIKSINLHEINNEVTRYLLSCEIAALSNLGKLENTQHNNIVRLFQIIIIDNYIYLVMELLQGGTLADYIKKHPNGLPQQQALSILRQILEGYKYIKDKHIVHRDLKPDNILFKSTPNQNNRVAIIDFGYCEMKQVPNKPQVFYNVGSPKYMSPQAYKDNKYSQKSDIWAIGVMLYEMLVGKTCDNGMTMQNYLEMLQTKGIPLPDKLKNLHKHLLTCMLAYNQNSRIQCDEALKVLNLHQSPNTRPITQYSLPFIKENMRATLDINLPERPNRNNPVFHSALLPSKVGPSFSNYPNEQPFRQAGLLRNESGFSQHNENKMGLARYPATSFCNDNNNFKRIIFPQRTRKIENLQFHLSKQIIHKKHPENNMNQMRNINLSPFPNRSIHFVEYQTPSNFRQPTIHFQRTAMNQIVNQDININSFPSQIKSSVQNTPKDQLNFSKIVKQSTPLQVHVHQFNNMNPKMHANYFQEGRIREVQNFAEPSQLKKHISQQVHFVGVNHFQQNNPIHRQSEEFGKPFINQNKNHNNNFNQARIHNDLTLTRHPYPHLTQNIIPRHDLTMTRVPQYESQQNISNSDLTQTRIPIQLIPNGLTQSKAPRVIQEPNTLHKQIIHQQVPNIIHNQKNDDFSERVIINKHPNKHAHVIRELVSIKPQITSLRNIDNKVHYVKMNAFSEPMNRQQPLLLMVRPSNIT